MSLRELIDTTREEFVRDSNVSPTREIVYTRFRDDFVYPVDIKHFSGWLRRCLPAIEIFLYNPIILQVF